MNTESYRGLRAKLPILDEFLSIDKEELDRIVEAFSKCYNSDCIKIIGETLCIE